MFGLISVGVKLLIDVVAEVSMDKGVELVLGIHFRQENIVSEFEVLKSKEFLDLIALFYFKSRHSETWVGPLLWYNKGSIYRGSVAFEMFSASP